MKAEFYLLPLLYFALFPKIEAKFSAKNCKDPRNKKLVIITPYEENATVLIQSEHRRDQIEFVGEHFFLAHLHIARALNATIEFRLSKGGFGVLKGDGSWDGLVGDLMNCRGDITMAMAYTHARAAVIDYGISIQQQSLGFITGPVEEPEAKIKLASISKILSYLLFCISSSSLALSVLLTICDFKCKEDKKLRAALTSCCIKTTGNVQILLKVFLEQAEASILLKKGFSAKLFFGTWILCLIILTNTIKSKFVSNVIKPSLVEPPSNFKELIESKYTIYAAEYSNTILESEVKSLNTSVSKSLVARIIHSSFLECFEKVYEKNTACINYAKYLDLFAKQLLTDSLGEPLYVASDPSEKFLRMMVGFGLQPNSPIKDVVDQISQNLCNFGLFEKWEQDSAQLKSRIGRRASKKRKHPTKDQLKKIQIARNRWKKLYKAIVGMLVFYLLPVSIFLCELFNLKRVIAATKKLIHCIKKMTIRLGSVIVKFYRIVKKHYENIKSFVNSL